MLLPELPTLSNYPTSGHTLLDWLRPRIDDSMLEEIAAAEDGINEKEHLEALRKIRDTGELPLPLSWNPSEVLEIFRYSEPEDTIWKSSGVGERGHLMCAFCCAVLMQTSGGASDTITIVQLTASVLALGREPSAAGLRFIWNRTLTLSEDSNARPFCALAILLLGASRFNLLGDDEVRKAGEWVRKEEAEASAREASSMFYDEGGWLLGLDFSAGKNDTWRKLAQEILLDLPRPNAETAAILQDIGRRIVEARTGDDLVD